MEHWKKIKVDDSKRVGLVAKVIPMYFSEKYKDSVQPFYNYPFNIGNVNKPEEKNFLNCEERKGIWKEKKDKFKGYKAKKKFKEMTDKEKEEHRSYLEFQSWNKFERELRLVRNQDIVTWLLCTELIDKLKIDELNIKELKKLRLKDINTDTAKEEKNNILNRVMPMELPVTVYEVNKGGYIIKNKPLHTIYIKEAKTKLLKQGNFKALVKDRRLNGLFSFVKTPSEAESESNPISKSRVESELGKYQNARLDIIEDMLALEKKLIDKYNSLDTDNFSLDTDNFHNMLTGWLELKGEAKKARFQNDVKLLTAVRNAFSHNQYPMYDENLFGNIERFSLSSSNIIESKGLDIAVKLKEEVSIAVEKIQNEEDNKKVKET